MGAYALNKPNFNRQTGAAIGGLVADGSVSPVLGPAFALADAGDALHAIEGRTVTGKVVLRVRGETPSDHTAAER